MANIVEPNITQGSSWDDVTTGSTLIYNVANEAGDANTAVGIVFIGSSDHQIWYDLSDPLVEGNTYQVDIRLKPGSTGFSTPFEVAYYDDGDAINKQEFDLTDGWQTVTCEFVAGATTLGDPSLRLIGWDAGAQGDSLIIESVNMELTQEGNGGDTTVPVSDPTTFPRSDAKSFSMDTVEARGGTLVAWPEPTTDEDFQTVVQRDFNSRMEWGEEDTEIMPALDSPFDERFFRTTMLEGTSSGSDVEGGTGWEGEFLAADHAALRYKVRFQPNFDYVKGGKLPGLFGGDSPSGGASADNGFSARMMWRTDGQGELYTYNLNREETYGDSIGRGLFNFTAGVWHTIEQEVIMNTVDDATGDVYGDGVVRIWFDGQPVFEVTGMVFRTSNDVTIDGIMSTIFLGGSDSSWRTPKDQYIETGDFKIWTPAS